jgi:parallel beta-helix repeat protein
MRAPGSPPRARMFVVLAILSMFTVFIFGARVSAPRELSVVVASAGVPAAPATVIAVPGNESATVYWTVPYANGSAITNYDITPYLGWVRQPSIRVGLVTSTTITGLTNAQTYTFRVAASNAVGIGPERSSAGTTVGAPVAPTDVTARSGTETMTMTVSWKAPATDNGSPISGYIITPYMQGKEQAARTVGSSTVSTVLIGLTFGANYTFSVRATNANGTGIPSWPSTSVLLRCVGVPMTAGQADINSHGTGTTFCLSGTHNWTLTPKAGDKLVGPAILDGGNVTKHAVVAKAPNVGLASLTIRRYNNGNGTQDGAIHIDDSDSAKSTASGWRLANLNVGFNSASGSGAGNNWWFFSSRYHDNRQEGIGGAVGNGVTILAVEIDHNNFTDSTYTKRNSSCGDEAGGFKWVTNNVTVRDSWIHHNACKGLWADLNANGAVITHNLVDSNWDEGIFVEISSGATVTHNIVINNGWHNYNGDGSGCPWTFGGGITLASSDHAVIEHNTVHGNCNGITGNQQDRPDGNPGLLANVSVRNNVISGAGVTGFAEDNGADLTQRNIVFADNSIGGGIEFCRLSC